MGKNTFKKPQKPRKARKAKTVNGRQNQRLKKLEKEVFKGIEYKSRDIISVGAPIPSTGYSNEPMFQLEQGGASNQRNGEKVLLKMHKVCMTLAAQDTTNSIRVMWIYTPSTTPLDIDDVLEYGNYTTDGDLVFSSPLRRKAVTSENTYTVLFDRVYHFSADRRLITDKYDLIPKKGGRSCSFNSTGSVQPDNYQLQILAISDSTASGHPAISYVCRSKYSDL